MRSFIPPQLKGCISAIILILNTFFWAVPIFSFAIFKLLIPIPSIRFILTKCLHFFAVSWITVNNFHWRIMQGIDIRLTGAEALSMQEWYLVISNHQSWVDILILQYIFNLRIPYLKFFLKKELIWVPIMGIAWWALDFPFMQRYSKAFLEKNPHLKGKDLEATKKACEKFKLAQVSVMNFVEGTRFTKAKHDRQQSPFQHLLKPKAGGIAFVISAMHPYLTRIVNVTIFYPDGPREFWDFLCGKIKRVHVHVEVAPVDEALIGDYFNDPAFREEFQQWVNRIWHEKDRKITAMMAEKEQ